MKRKLLSAVTALSMCACMAGMLPVTASAAETVTVTRTDFNLVKNVDFVIEDGLNVQKYAYDKAYVYSLDKYGVSSLLGAISADSRKTGDLNVQPSIDIHMDDEHTYYAIKYFDSYNIYGNDELYPAKPNPVTYYYTDGSWQKYSNFDENTISISNETFNLKSHTIMENVESHDTAIIYSTEISEEYETKRSVVGKLNASVSDINLNIRYDDKHYYTAYVSRGASTLMDKSSIAQEYYYNPETNTWSGYAIYVNGAVNNNNQKDPIQIDAKRFPDIANSGHEVQEFYLSYKGEDVAVVSGEQFKIGGFAYAISPGDYLDYTWKAYMQYEVGNALYKETYTYEIYGKFVPHATFSDVPVRLIGYACKATEPKLIAWGGTFDKTFHQSSYKVEDIKTEEQANGIAQEAAEEAAAVAKFFEEYTAEIPESETTSPMISLKKEIDKEAETDDIVKSIDVDIAGHGGGFLLENGDPVEEYSASEIDSGVYTIPDYKDYKTYHLKIATDDTFTNFYYFKWNDNLKRWEYRCNTAETMSVDLALDLTNFSYCPGDGVLSFSAVNNPDKATKIKDISKADVYAGTATETLQTNTLGSYYFTFTGDTENHGDWNSTPSYTYRLVGIDVVLTEALEMIEAIPYYAAHTTARAGDFITVTGTSSDGLDVKYTAVPEITYDAIPLYPGEYTVVNETTGIKEDVKVDENGVINESDSQVVLNLKTPILSGSYKVTALNGEVVDEGTMSKKRIEAITDLGLSANRLASAGVYTTFESKYGFLNSVNAEDFTSENGFLGTGDGKLLKLTSEDAMQGDITADAEVSVLDIIKEQKYLLNADSISWEQFVNADLNRDGSVDVFDLALLKRAVLNQN